MFVRGWTKVDEGLSSDRKVPMYACNTTLEKQSVSLSSDNHSLSVANIFAFRGTGTCFHASGTVTNWPGTALRQGAWGRHVLQLLAPAYPLLLETCSSTRNRQANKRRLRLSCLYRPIPPIGASSDSYHYLCDRLDIFSGRVRPRIAVCCRCPPAPGEINHYYLGRRDETETTAVIIRYLR